MTQWQFFPKSIIIPDHLKNIIDFVFKKNESDIDSEKYRFGSNAVLKILCEDLKSLGYKVETGKTTAQKIHVPVLFGKNGQLDKSFDADAYSSEYATVIEVEAGRGYTNHQFLKDLFQACVMVNVEYLVIGIRNIYNKNNDFDKVISFFNALYSSEKFKLPLKGVLIIGY
jgi:hypothetical protein